MSTNLPGILGMTSVTGDLANVFTAATRDRLRRVRIAGDGHCGAYVLAFINLAKTGESLGSREVRKRVYELAKTLSGQANLSQRMRARFKRVMRPAIIHSFFEDTEMVLFIHSLGLSVCILSSSIGSSGVCVHKYPLSTQTGWVFIVLRGFHWEVLVRVTKKDTMTPLFTPSIGDALLRHVCKQVRCVVDGVTPAKTYFTRAGGTYLFELGARDRIWCF